MPIRYFFQFHTYLGYFSISFEKKNNNPISPFLKEKMYRSIFISNFQLILAACSQFFSKLFHENAQFGPNSLIVLPKDIRPQDFAHLLQYMYQGQVEVPREDLDHVLKAAQILKIEGLIRSADEFSSANRRRKSKPKYRFMKSVNKKTIVNNVPPFKER